MRILSIIPAVILAIASVNAAEVKISDLPETNAPSASAVLPIVDAGVTWKVQKNNLLGSLTNLANGDGSSLTSAGAWTFPGGNPTTAGSVSTLGTNYASEAVITNGVTLGGVRQTSWPAGGIVGTVSNSVAQSGLLAVDATRTNGIAATTAHINTTLATSTPLEVPELYTGSFKLYRGALTPIDAGTQLDFGSTNRYWSCTLTGAVTFTTANLVAGKHGNVMLIGVATNATLAFPAGWIFIGYKPTYLTANKHADLYLKSTGTTDAGVWAFYGEEQ